ncbi:MAG: aminotransferase class IV [Anaerolineae bacterium]|nr:aminotransferase class IV [Anaerolineae bacterium]
MNALCYVNGHIQPVSEGGIDVTDLGLQRGYGVFDYVPTCNGKLFHFADHLARLHRSAAALHLKLPIPDDKITSIADRLIAGSALERPALRLILTGGDAHAQPLFAQPNFIMIAENSRAYPDDAYKLGVELIAIYYQRELPHVKSINYLNALRLEPLRQEKGAFGILYHSQHGITECPRSNFFIFRGDTLVTPKDNVLLGITRKVVLELIQDHFSIEERAIAFDELEAADEAFITSSTKGAMPVVRIDDLNIGDGSVGPRTKTIIDLFTVYAEAY